jgi:hypothetical protein
MEYLHFNCWYANAHFKAAYQQRRQKTMAMLKTKAREVFVLIKNSLQQLILSLIAATKFFHPPIQF